MKADYNTTKRKPAFYFPMRECEVSIHYRIVIHKSRKIEGIQDNSDIFCLFLDETCFDPLSEPKTRSHIICFTETKLFLNSRYYPFVSRALC